MPKIVEGWLGESNQRLSEEPAEELEIKLIEPEEHKKRDTLKIVNSRNGMVTSKSGLNSPRRSAIILDLNMQAELASKHK